MRTVIQRVKEASVFLNNYKNKEFLLGKIKRGILAYVCFSPEDTEKTINKNIIKIIHLRIFQDKKGDEKHNTSLADFSSAILYVPNFSLYADCKKGRRPHFSSGIKFSQAEKFFIILLKKTRQYIQEMNLSISVESGEFGKQMYIESIADGPLNIILNIP